MEKDGLKLQFFDPAPEQEHRRCDADGCCAAGEHRAPKSRHCLNEYYWFCLDHVREYNKGWNYFSGMSPSEVEAFNRHATCWERPTWRFGTGAPDDYRKHLNEGSLHAAWQNMRGGADHAAKASRRQNSFYESSPPPRDDSYTEEVMEALAILDLTPPVTMKAIRERYKKLAKKYHPDATGTAEDSENEARIRLINQAWHVLKAHHREETAA